MATVYTIANPCVAGSTYQFPAFLFQQADTKLLQTSVTLAAGDVTVHRDATSLGNADNLPTEVGSTGELTVILSAAETTGATKYMTVKFSDVAGSEWCDAVWIIPLVVAVTVSDFDESSDLVQLANDAITSAKYDESTAYPIKSADTGSTQIARTGADGDTLETLSDEIAVVDTLLDTTGVVVASHTTAAKAEIEAEAVDALESFDLDHLIQVTAGSEEPTDGSYLDQVMHKNSSQTFDATTDSLEAVRDHLSSGSVTVSSSITASGIATIRRGDSLSLPFTDLGDISGRSKLWFTVKDNLDDADTAAIIQIEETAGLLYLNAAAAGTAANGDITVSDASDGDITIVLDETETDDLEYATGLFYDVQMTDGTDVTTLATGTANVVLDVTRTVT